MCLVVASNISILELNNGKYEIYFNYSGESFFVGVYETRTPVSVIVADIESAKLKLKTSEVN